MTDDKAIEIETLAIELASLARGYRASNDEKKRIEEEMWDLIGSMRDFF